MIWKKSVSTEECTKYFLINCYIELMSRKIAKRLALIFILLIILCCVIGWTIFIYNATSEVPVNVRRNVQAVVMAELRSSAIGDYSWENELLEQSKLVKSMPLEDRVNYYREILVRFDFDNYRGVFMEEDVIADDFSHLYLHLMEYKKTKNYEMLFFDGKRRLNDWIMVLQIIVKNKCRKDAGEC
ncbi:hypothetical protein V8J88_02080 [Massilia sp. W12]|uniref:hypothetical protein n=1 Tax=Massilia sp. W12 TaxID=3126507 RepID=UPI0030D5B418